jgi:hypothetical protein
MWKINVFLIEHKPKKTDTNKREKKGVLKGKRLW